MLNKILIVGPAWVGDMVMAQSLFKLLKLNDPACQIDVLAPTWSFPLLKRMPEVTDSIPLTPQHGELALKKRYQIGQSLREKNYTQAIVLPNSFKSALVPFWANIPKRTGWQGEFRYFVLNDVRKLDAKCYPLMIERFMALALSPNATLPKAYPIPELVVQKDVLEKTRAKFNLIEQQKILAICPGAEFGPAKRWPENYYAEIANEKLKSGWKVWIFGSPNDQSVADQIMQLTSNQCVNLTGKTKLEEAIDLLSVVDSVVTNDSGLMHIAAALNKPLIAMYGPTSSAFTPPLNKNAEIVSLSLDCQPCFKRTCPVSHHHCMQLLKPEKVLSLLENAES